MSEAEAGREAGLAQQVARCAALIEQAEGLQITSGAGLGVDSGLPDFRGAGGFWRAYPALGQAGLHFPDIACPQAFVRWPRLAWGFYGHRLRMYRETEPGPAFRILGEIVRRLPAGARVFTSNVDGHFQKAGFDARDVVECHGSIHHLQCLHGCRGEVWPADGFEPEVDAEACLLRNDAPVCPHCGGIARPNILMFDDPGWIDDPTRAQLARLHAWRRKVGVLLVIEIGAGTAIPTVRLFGESQGAPLIRINLGEAQIDTARGVALPMTAGAGLDAIAAVLCERGFFGR
jgi:NAD-dependent SIR2 family protein deacetylase